MVLWTGSASGESSETWDTMAQRGITLTLAVLAGAPTEPDSTCYQRVVSHYSLLLSMLEPTGDSGSSLHYDA